MRCVASTPSGRFGCRSRPVGASTTVAFNFSGRPALTVPLEITVDGLPFGIQLVGRRWSEVRLIDVARTLELIGVVPGFAAAAAS